MNTPSTERDSITSESWLDRFLTKLDCAWDVAQDVGRVLKYARLSLLVTVITGCALIFVDQGQDLLVIHAEHPLTLFVFYPAVVFWALNAWYWARSTLTHGAKIPWQETCAKPFFGGRLKRVKWLVRNVPRIIGTGAFLLIAIAQLRAAARNGLGPSEQWWLFVYAGLSVILALVFFFFTVHRRRMAQALANKLAAGSAPSKGPHWLMLDKEPRYSGAKSLAELTPAIRRSFIVLTLILCAMFVLVLADPTAFSLLKPDVVFLVASSLWIAPGTWLLFVAKRGDFPALTILAALALLFSFVNDNHGLRQSDSTSLPDPNQRMTPEETLKIWHRSWRARGTERPTLIMVATAGGGSRAAYWTASLLGTVQDLHPEFNKQLFGISGVSGGSLGAAVFRGLLSAPGKKASDTEAQVESSYRARASEILKQDFLSATLAAMILPDFVQRFLFWGFLPDRAEALELSWETAWQDVMGAEGEQNLLAADFLNVWPKAEGSPGRENLPALFLNGTSVATGKRIVTSNLDVAKSLTDAFDFFSHWPMDIPLSTAANNSARFPIIGPAGTLHREATGQDENEMDRIVDGGYFENFGAATALDILQTLTAAPCHEDVEPCDYDLVVIQISSDPGYRGVESSQNGKAADSAKEMPAPDASPGSFASELRSPLKTLLNTRTARGVLAAQTLHDWVAARSSQGAHFIEFRLDIDEKESAPPLGWVLSKAATGTMDCQLRRPSNERNLKRLSRLIGHSNQDLEDFLQELDAECGG